MTDRTRIEIASGFKDFAPMRLGEGVTSGFSIIGIKGKVWSLRHKGETYYFTRDDDGTPLPYIDVVILGENPHITKTYYPQGTYTEDSNNPPTCSAIDGDVPDPNVPIPQSPTCRTCKRNVWTTIAETGRPGKECKDSKRLAVLLMPAMTEKLLGAPLNEAVMLRVPAASLRPLKSYSDSLVHRGVHVPAAVVTRIGFSREKQFEMKFDLLQPLTNAEVPVIKELIEDVQTQVILGRQDIVREIEHKPPIREERIETGIMSAFGKQQREVGFSKEVTPPKPRGRPPGSANKPKLVIDPDGSDEPQLPLTAARAQEARTERPEEVLPPEQPVPWQESDDELDETLRKVVDQKIQGMLK
jgi:hypothetical protein